jgi:hypothetical protein
LWLQTNSFLHLHLGIDATGLPPGLDIHHLVVNTWADLDAPQNVCIASIPSVVDTSLAPPGKAVVHAYTAGSEPYALWEGLSRGSPAYEQLKEERTQCLWQVGRGGGGGGGCGGPEGLPRVEQLRHVRPVRQRCMHAPNLCSLSAQHIPQLAVPVSLKCDNLNPLGLCASAGAGAVYSRRSAAGGAGPGRDPTHA